jgi:NAD(P)-dependent dehydrogenase (short-subunit alcohol dehydrogenase family)
MRGLAGKVAIVTGAGSGIGAACAKRLAEEQVKVAVADRDEASANAVADAIRSEGGVAFAVKVDVGVEAEVAGMVADTVRQFGKLDILHNNAAATGPEVIGHDVGIAATETWVWDMTMTVNIRGVVLGCKYALQEMLPKKSGVIINTSSAASILGDLSRSAYAASKAAVDSITQNVATCYGKAGIRCVGISPGPIITPAMKGLFTREILDMYTRHLTLPRTGVPEDIAGALAYLASDDASFITGQTIQVDGGMTCHAPWFAELSSRAS